MTETARRRKNKISFVTLGCKLNYAETSTYERAILAAGFESVPWTARDADFCLVNTCSVTEHSDKKCRNIVRKLHRTAPGAKIVVTGCSAELRRADLASLEGVVAVFGAKEKHLVAPFIIGASSGISPEPAPGSPEGIFPAYSTGERTRSFLKVQDGCDFKCAYCTVPYARGESRNVPISVIAEEARAIAAAGVREIVITGVNTGDFGKTTGESFLDLLKVLDGIEGIERYRISSIEPNLLTEEILEWMSRGTKFLPHFHIPLQSGHDIVLKEMGRRYTTGDFKRKIDLIRKLLEAPGKPKVFFGIDVIVGFPGETDEMFSETVRFLREDIKPAFIHIFPYSRRPGTPAAERPDQVQDSVKTARVEALEKLCAELNEEFIEENKGIAEKVLFESSDKKGKMFGYTGNYIRIERPYDKALVGEIVDVTI